MFRIPNKIGQRKPRETSGNEGRDLLFSDWNLLAVTRLDQDAPQKPSLVRISDFTLRREVFRGHTMKNPCKYLTRSTGRGQRTVQTDLSKYISKDDITLTFQDSPTSKSGSWVERSISSLCSGYHKRLHREKREWEILPRGALQS